MTLDLIEASNCQLTQDDYPGCPHKRKLYRKIKVEERTRNDGGLIS
jgi:hypothetical protein